MMKMLLWGFLVWISPISLIKAYMTHFRSNVVGSYGPTRVAYVHDETIAARCQLEPLFLQGIIVSKYT